MPPRTRIKRRLRSSIFDTNALELPASPSQLTPPLEPNFIGRLPNEMLQEIFKIHVRINLDTPVRLILVCKLWQTLGSLSTLWGNIYYGEWSQQNWDIAVEEEGLLNEIGGMIRCSTPRSLKRAIEKTKTSKFNLSLYQKIWHNNSPLDLSMLDKETISKRCRLLRFITYNAYHDFLPFIKQVPFNALEEFIHYSWHGGEDIDTLMANNLRRSRAPLWNLSTGTLQTQPNLYPALRLRKLVIQALDGIIFNEYNKDPKSFENLEELIISRRVSFHQRIDDLLQRGHLFPMPSLKKVEMTRGSLRFLPRGIYSQLTHLTLKEPFIRGTFDFEDKISLPSLYYLRYEGSWKFLIYFDAPKLVELVLRFGRPGPRPETRSERFESFQEILFCLEVLRIDIIMPARDLIQLLERKGDKLRIISMTHFGRDETISQSLVSALVRDQSNGPICPFLSEIELLTAEFSDADAYGRTRRRLQRIIDVRVPKGHLRTVRHGCYSFGGSSWQRNSVMSKNWMTFNCLESV